jgi:hypothetical protein
MKLQAAALALALALLFLGCAEISKNATETQGGSGQEITQPPLSGPNNTTGVQARTGAPALPNITTTSGPAPPKGQPDRTCALNLTPDEIYSGQSVEIGFSVYSRVDSFFTFNCGDTIENISSGGLVSGIRICTFSRVGDQDVWIKDKYGTCANVTLKVKAPIYDQRTCYIDQGSVVRDLANHYYEAKVYFRGFQPEDNVSWHCDNTWAYSSIGSGPGVGMPLYKTIYCQFPSQPQEYFIDVYVGQIKCGDIQTS